MDICNQPPKQQSCLNHNQPIVMFHSDPKIGACCLICLQNLTGMTLAEQIFNQQQQNYDKAKQKIDENHQWLKQFLDCFLNYKENVVSSLDKIKQLILDQITIVNQSQSKLDLIFKSDRNQSTLIDELEKVCNNQQKFNKDMKDQFEKQIECLQSKLFNFEQLLAIIDKNKGQEVQEANKIKSQQIIIQEVNIESLKTLNKFSYQLIKESALEQKNDCFAFAFNKDNSIFIVACRKEIIVYEFVNGNISKQIQRLQDHKHSVVCLYFMRNSNSFVSGSYDCSIIIWALDQNDKYIPQQVLKEHEESVVCIIMNKNEDEIMSGSKDKTLKFWKQRNGKWVCLQSINTKQWVKNMSLNEKENKLITCQQNITTLQLTSYALQILTIQNSYQWNIMQTLDFTGQVQRLSFTITDQFAIQNKASNCLEIYDYDENKKQFIVKSQVQMQQIKYDTEFFPCQFIKSRNILTFKHGAFLNIFKVNEKYNYELIQSIECGHSESCGRMTDDGQFLVTWDYSTKKIQIRQIKQLE